MVTYYVKLNEIYTIAATAECKVYNASGVQVATCPANDSINVKAATNKLKLSDDNAAIKKAVSESGGGTSEECEQHIANSDIHTTLVEKAKCASHIADTEVHVTVAEKNKITNAALLDSINNFRAINQFHMPLYANSDFYASGQAQFNGTTTFNGEVFFNHVVDGYQNLDFAETIELGFVSHATCEVRYVFKADSGYVQIKKPNCKAFEDQSVLNKAENDTLYAPKNYANKNFVMITDSNGDASSSSIITTTELNMLNNIRTNIQSQLDALSERIAALES